MMLNFTMTEMILALLWLTLAMKPRLSRSLLVSRTFKLVRSPCRMFMLCRCAMPLATSRAVAKIGIRSGSPWIADRFVRNQPLSTPSCQHALH